MNFREYISYIIIFLLIIISGSAVGGAYYYELLAILSLLIVSYIFITGSIISMSKSSFWMLVILVFILFVSMVGSNSVVDFNSYLHIVVKLIIGLIVANSISLKTFIRQYISIILVIATLSLIVHTLIQFSVVDVTQFPVLKSESSNYYNLLLYVARTGEYSGMLKNFGIFREGGVYQFYLILGLILQFILYEYKNKIIIIILSLTILSTGSTAGVIIWTILVSVSIIIRKKSNPAIIFPIVVGLLIAYLSTTQYFYESVTKKLTEENYSYYVRINGSKIDLDIAKSFPIFGAGISKYSAEIGNRSYYQYGLFMGNSPNSFTSLSASLGVPFVFIVTICFFSTIFNKAIGISWLYKASTVLIFVLSFATQNLLIAPFSLTLLFYGMNSSSMQRIYLKF